MTKSSSDIEGSIQIEVFPQRIMNPETSEKLLTELYKVEGIIRFMIQGPRLPEFVPAGPGRGERVDHHKRQNIEVEGELLHLRVSVGRIRMEVKDASTKEEVRKICESILPYPFEFKEGNLFQKKATVTDYARFGADADPMVLGMTDPKSRASEDITYIDSSNKKDE